MSATVRRLLKNRVLLTLAAAVPIVSWMSFTTRSPAQSPAQADGPSALAYRPRIPYASSGYGATVSNIAPWGPDASLAEIGALWSAVGVEQVRSLDRQLSAADMPPGERATLLLRKATSLNYVGDPGRAYEALKESRTILEGQPQLAAERLYTIIFLQGVTALRLGENENCVDCRGVSACILPLSPAAVHRKPRGSRLAAQHFTEYLNRFPDDVEARWLLNLAHMTLGEHPDKVDPRHRISLDRFTRSEFNVGAFQDIGHLVGLNRSNLAGGAIMDDFTNDGLLDIVVTSSGPDQPMAFYRNTGDGHFQETTRPSGLSQQLGGLNCVQTDFNNDGRLDVFIPRGAWLQSPIRPSLLRNEGDGRFTDVTVQAGLQEPLNSISAVWRDYDNDGFLDLFVCCERQPNRLYRNQGDGTFKDQAEEAGLLRVPDQLCKGAAWIDYDNDDYPDLFLNFLDGLPRLFHNNRKGGFTDVTASMGIDGPTLGFSCWAFDYDNDGWEDLFATCYERSMTDVVMGLQGLPYSLQNSRLFRNLKGKGFEDVTGKVGLDMGFTTMGSNFGDVDNDGFLDMYLGTGDPDLSTLAPNRMFKNVGGARFSEITGTSRTGHLQKGHGVAFGDWDRDGNVDLFIELGGAVPGDRYHNVLFQNPGHDHQWITLKLVGKKSNRAALGARIKIDTAGPSPQTIHRTVTSGSSFGANPLVQTIGLGRATRVATVEIRWPGSHTTQTFRDLPVNQSFEMTELAGSPRRLNWTKLPSPKLSAQSAGGASGVR